MGDGDTAPMAGPSRTEENDFGYCESGASPMCEPWDLTMRSLDSAMTVSQLSIATSTSNTGESNDSGSSVSIVDARAAGMLCSAVDVEVLARNSTLHPSTHDEHSPLVPTGAFSDSEDPHESADFSNPATDPEPERHPSTNSLHSRTAASYGKAIGEDHVNFVLMYDMLTGIRHSVSACQAKPSRPLTEQDFKYSRTYNFLDDCADTSPSRYEFRFKDYCPWVFRGLREAFHIEPADYLMSLTGKYALSEIGSPGKSGSLFYFSQDFRYIIKTIRQSEHQFLRKILRHYYEHIKRNSNSLLTRFYGLHRVRMSKLRKIYFVVMGNIFPPHKDIHETFDLKGSTLGRFVTTDELENASGIVTLKDLNWIERGRKLKLGPVKATLLMNQLIADCTFLAKMRIMDYSLLAGVHYVSRGNVDRLRDRSLTMYERHEVSDEPSLSSSTASATGHFRATSPSATHARGSGAVPIFKPSAISASAAGDIAGVPRERRLCVFYADDGGFRSSARDGTPSDEIYYLGVIDILTPYTVSKRFEHMFKSIRYNRRTISAVNPVDYSKRFLRFMAENILQDASANYAHKALPAIPPAYRARDLGTGDEAMLLIENVEEEALADGAASSEAHGDASSAHVVSSYGRSPTIVIESDDEVASNPAAFSERVDRAYQESLRKNE